MARGRIVVLIAVALAAAFALGWWLRGSPARPSASPPTKSSAPERGVILDLDAGAINLLPDASLELRPIEPPEAPR